MNPHINAVTGCPRRPQDQGSVESMTKLVKRILGTVLTERRLAGDILTGLKCQVWLLPQSILSMVVEKMTYPRLRPFMVKC
jgi:hypothetical protein